ncbi:MAG: hypothetical protein JXA96_04340 [Sedimentisphaerales bacterium]|nr:hypothetical protein [Sedimentisphaerales bacterium]
MNNPENNKWLDKELSSIIGSEKIKPDFKQWKQNHPCAVEILTSRLVDTSVSKHPLNIRNIIMKNPIIKLAAAATIIIAVSLVLCLTGGPVITSIAWGNVAEKIRNIDTYSFRVRTIETTGPRKEGFEFVDESETIVYFSERYGERTESYMDGNMYIQTFINLEKNEFTGVILFGKEYENSTLSTDQIQRLHESHPKRIVLRVLQGDYFELGRNIINGTEIQGVQINDSTVFNKSPMPISDFTASLWIDTKTELPVWVEISYTEEGSSMQTTLIMDEFQWNIELLANDFEPNIPDDYVLAEYQASQSEQQQKTLASEELLSTKVELPDLSNLMLLDLEDITPETITPLVGHLEVWKAQYNIMSTWPDYFDVMPQLYEELRVKLDIDNLTSEQLMATAVALREKFWDKGGRLSETSYPYGYATQILLEMANKQNPENLTITDELVETIQTVEPSHIFNPNTDEKTANTELRFKLKQIRAEQFEQIKQEVHTWREPAWEDFVRVNDLAILCGFTKDFEQGLEVITWLLEHADTGGWTAYLQPLGDMQNHFLKNEKFNYNILTSTEIEYPEEYRYTGLPSFKGPRKRNVKPLHILDPNPIWRGD